MRRISSTVYGPGDLQRDARRRARRACLIPRWPPGLGEPLPPAALRPYLLARRREFSESGCWSASSASASGGRRSPIAWCAAWRVDRTSRIFCERDREHRPRALGAQSRCPGSIPLVTTCPASIPLSSASCSVASRRGDHPDHARPGRAAGRHDRELGRVGVARATAGPRVGGSAERHVSRAPGREALRPERARADQEAFSRRFARSTRTASTHRLSRRPCTESRCWKACSRASSARSRRRPGRGSHRVLGLVTEAPSRIAGPCSTIAGLRRLGSGSE